MDEQSLAEEALDRWRAKVMARDNAYHQRVLDREKKLENDAKIARKKAPPATYTINSYFSR